MDDETFASAVRTHVASARELASHLSPLDRARFTRDLARAVYDAVKFDALLGGTLVGGADRELDGLSPIGDAAGEWCDYLSWEQIEGPRDLA